MKTTTEKPDLTDIQEKRWTDKLTHRAIFYINRNFWYLINHIESETEYKQGDWLYIPRKDSKNNAIVVEIWSVPDPMKQKRIVKICQKFSSQKIQLTRVC